MARQPKLRKKKVGRNTYWFTRTGGDTYLGNIKDVPFSKARRLFNDHVSNVMEADSNSKRKWLTAGGAAADLMPQNRVPQRSLGLVVGRFDSFARNEGPHPPFLPEQFSTRRCRFRAPASSPSLEHFSKILPKAPDFPLQRGPRGLAAPEAMPPPLGISNQ